MLSFILKLWEESHDLESILKSSHFANKFWVIYSKLKPLFKPNQKINLISKSDLCGIYQLIKKISHNLSIKNLKNI